VALNMSSGLEIFEAAAAFLRTEKPEDNMDGRDVAAVGYCCNAFDHNGKLVRAWLLRSAT
jgi:hypothetical protein